MYERFINELKSYSIAICILSKGYLPISLIPPSKLETILQQVKATLAAFQDHKEINLPVTVVIPIYYQFKLRQLLRHSRKDPLYLYIMLKQRKSQFNLESTECK